MIIVRTIIEDEAGALVEENARAIIDIHDDDDIDDAIAQIAEFTKVTIEDI